MKATLSDSGQLARIKENGCIRMGEAGAGRRIAEQLWKLILQQSSNRYVHEYLQKQVYIAAAWVYQTN